MLSHPVLCEDVTLVGFDSSVLINSHISSDIITSGAFNDLFNNVEFCLCYSSTEQVIFNIKV